MSESTEHVTYAQAGVDVVEGARAVEAIRACAASTARPEVIGGLGGFGCLFSAEALKRMEDPVLVSGTDGVGTKLALAQLLGRHDSVGQDLVAMCVDDIVPSGAEPLFFLDYLATGKLDATQAARVISGIARGCRMAGCALIGGEMAEHPGVMRPDDYDLAGFCVGAVDRPKMLGSHRVHAGDVILGLPSSGIHSNGYSLVRRVLGTVGIEPGTPEASAKAAELMRPRADLGGQSMADAVMAPTAIYARAITEVLADGSPIHAMAHITGGGITENLARAIPNGLCAEVMRGAAPNNPAWEVPAVIGCIIQAAALTPDEAYQTFNMGVGMSVVCDSDDEAKITSAFQERGIKPFPMGRVIEGHPGERAQVVYR
ncbi:phosphoribosylformylglycinamidine cyclo-ligase [Coriobacterium glomerans PW2]|uniref:Phosphoribosylformylglycinamidine cyclo-ligase n=1 Tax=Coriobacterium glomerans (strain ATCC 49209 / DSM 20642 / JCM 10262 / PW2) TaxID=700015 RepID=F2N9A3_CORGP|nr:phosphoribosylformylglycinamidine cyclo-ligase [Coriobacterium glomerans]AEB07851.1 phosphoribosylformylglycinamidine cyclo-ligase [Coriobacterium glomerans PW2]